MRTIFKFLALAFIAALSGAVTTYAFHFALRPGSTPSLDMTYVDFLSITLTALSLMITVLGFFIAAASVIGWTTIESKLREHSVSYFKDQLKDDGPLRAEFEKLIAAIAYEGIENVNAERRTARRTEDGGTDDTEYVDGP